LQEAIVLIFTYVWGAWRHRWLALVVAWVVAMAGWIWVSQLPEAYVAKARVYVDTNSVLRPLLKGLAIQPNVSQRVALMSRQLLSRPNLEKLMRMTDLDLEVNTEQAKEDMLTRLSASISLGAADDSSLYYISVKDEDRDIARRVAQSLITVFIESSLGDKRSDSSVAQAFLDAQIVEYEKRLVAAERRLALFKQEHVGVLSGGDVGYYSRLGAAQADLSGAQLQLRELERRQGALQRQLDGEEPVFLSSPVASSGSLSPLDSRIQTLRVRMDDLLSVYTTKHPGVRQISGLITELEAEKVAEYTQLAEESGGDYGGLATSPVYQGMRSMLAETEAGVAELRVRVAEYERRVTELNGMVGEIPETETQLKQLDRDYAVVSRQHQQLLQSRESAALSENVEQSANDVVFRVIDPPFVPLKPSEPNKMVLNGTVLIAALGAGVGVALLLFLLSPMIGDPHALVNVTGLPLLGSISLKQQPDERRAELYSLATFASLTGGLLLTYVGLTLVRDNPFAGLM
jgi:polysaccharide chain length determinant protein (PEP-CTERM system associated)